MSSVSEGLRLLQSIEPVRPLSVTFRMATVLTGIGKKKLYELTAEPDPVIKSFKVDGKRLIDFESLSSFIEVMKAAPLVPDRRVDNMLAARGITRRNGDAHPRNGG